MEIEMRAVEQVFPYEGNPRRISSIAVQKLADSIKQFGWKQPIVVDEAGVVIVGHVRLAAARKLGMKEVPCLVAKDLDEAKAKAFRLADNRLSEESAWDVKGLTREVQALGDAADELLVKSFSAEELEILRFDDEMAKMAHADVTVRGQAQTEAEAAAGMPEEGPLVPGIRNENLEVELVFRVPAVRARELKGALQEHLDTLLAG